MSAKRSVARNLAHAFLVGRWSLRGMVTRGARACGGPERWLRPLARRALGAFGRAAPPDPDALGEWIDGDDGFTRAWRLYRWEERLTIREVFCPAATMTPAPWAVPPLPTPGALAAWLGLTPAELDWFADCRGLLASVPAGPLRHYTYHWLVARPGKARLLEMPKQRLKALQQRLLHEVLERIPPHDAVHSYRRGCSVASYVAPHAGRGLVLRFDLRDFFPSIRAARVHALFRTAPRPGRAADETRLRALYRQPHLPQGAPTSPALANLCAYRLDCRLAGLALALGARYTRYADDLAFSGDTVLERAARRLQVLVCRVALEEGFEVHTRKTRFMRQGVRQQLAGVVLNAHPNVPRTEYDRLKAVLCNCVRHGPASQNRDGHADFRGHLAGRIAYVAMLNPARGRRLRAWFDRVAWG